MNSPEDPTRPVRRSTPEPEKTPDSTAMNAENTGPTPSPGAGSSREGTADSSRGGTAETASESSPRGASAGRTSAVQQPSGDATSGDRASQGPARTGRSRRESTSAEEPSATRKPAGTTQQPEPRHGTGTEEPTGEKEGGGRTAGIWLALILGAIVLVLLLIFILQNNAAAHFEYLGGQFELPLGVAMLLAAIAGALIMALVGSVRMIQMSLTIRRLRKQQEKMQRLAGR